MSEFESCEDICSLLIANNDFVAISIRTRMRANSNANILRDEPLYRSIGNSPKKKFHSMDDIFDATVRKRSLQFGVMSDCVPSPESDSSYASSSSSGSHSSSSPTCEISLLERLVRTHPVWFLPFLQRSGALHLLQGRDVGNFIVRSSREPQTMAVSVKLGNQVEHYLLKANGNRISLENSTHTFESVHQLVAHYSENSDEIPVCLRVPSSIAEATTRQQLTSLALLGQEFWSIPGNSTSPKESPVDALNRNFVQSGLGSQSSSSHSLSEISKKICRPTTLELGMWKSGEHSGSRSTTPNAPPVPMRWARSSLLSPLSQPSSVQSTPSEMQSTALSEKSGRQGKKKKRNSGSKADSIHYKDTEILELFKGTKTLYDDKASDYEDIWSPQYHERSHTPKLSTFKPDVIPHTPEVDNINHLMRNSNKTKTISPPENTAEDFTVQSRNFQNHRLSFNGPDVNGSNTPQNNNNLSKSNCNVEASSQNDMNRKSSGFYSEPVDSITLRAKLGGNRNAEPNIRWSQPSLSLLKIDFGGDDKNTMSKDDSPPHNKTGSGIGKPPSMLEKITKTRKQEDSPSNILQVGQQAISITRNSCADVSSVNKPVSQRQLGASKSSSNKNSQKVQRVACASVDNLWQIPNSLQTSKPHMINRKGGNGNTTKVKNTSEVTRGSEKAKEENTAFPIVEIPNKSWCLDNSWELVMWQKEEERRLKGNVAKFPIAPSPPNTPKLRKTSPSENSPTESSLVLMNNNGANEGYNSLQRRFSCYDNLERSKAEINAYEETDSDEDKISPPWDSTKWEHLMKIISESTQQLDLISSVGFNNHFSSNASLKGSVRSQQSCGVTSDPIVQVKMLEVGGNVDKAGKSVAAVVRRLATKEDGVFGPTLKSFVSCTIAAKIQDPYKVMRNVRQFISGMKNYLVGINVESEQLRKEIRIQTETLTNSEFLNIDAILEDVLVELVICPLHLHIRALIESYNATSEPLQLNNNASDSTTSKNGQVSFAKLKSIYEGFEESLSPMTKLDRWNEFVCQVQEMENYSTDSFVPLLSETLGSVSSQKLPSHVDYMIGLLPATLAEQNNYSLSMLQSAVAALKMKADVRKGSVSLSSVRVLIPDERNGTLIRKMVPVRNSTTNKEVAKIVASKLGIDPNDYILVTIKNGEETICPESELVYNCVDEGVTALAYKRLDAKIGWPQKIS